MKSRRKMHRHTRNLWETQKKEHNDNMNKNKGGEEKKGELKKT